MKYVAVFAFTMGVSTSLFASEVNGQGKSKKTKDLFLSARSKLSMVILWKNFHVTFCKSPPFLDIISWFVESTKWKIWVFYFHFRYSSGIETQQGFFARSFVYSYLTYCIRCILKSISSLISTVLGLTHMHIRYSWKINSLSNKNTKFKFGSAILTYFLLESQNWSLPCGNKPMKSVEF